MRLPFAFMVPVIVFAGFVHTAEAQDCLAQTWKGTIGNVPVTMEFTNEGEDAALVGRYYYRSSPVDLLLMSDTARPDRWKEIDPKGTVSGYLTLTCKEEVSSGTWSSPDGSRTLPFNAERLDAESYSKARLDGLKTVVTERDSIGKFRYELFTAQGINAVEGLRLVGDGKAVADINRELMKRFTDDLDESITCMTLGRWRRGEDHGYEYRSEKSMIAWNKGFVVIGESSSQYCGGAHPNYSEGATTYNLQTGKVEDVSQWLAGSYKEDIPKDSPLGKTMMKIYRQWDDSCDGESIALSGGSVWPTRGGITFRPSASYADTACIHEIIVPYSVIAPYLSSLGKASVQVFLSR